MNQKPAVNPFITCENLLREGIVQNEKDSILPSENQIAERLLRRSVEMREVYEELGAKLSITGLQEFLRSILYTTAFWGPESSEKARDEKRRLAETNELISEKAGELGALIEERERLNNSSSFGTDTLYHVCEVIDRAAANNHSFNSHVKKELHRLRMQYDLKYWPSISDFIQELADDAASASISALDPLTEAGTTSQRASSADFFKSFFAAIEECSYENHGPYPRGFLVSDKSIATIGNCALDLDDATSVDSQYIKALRQRIRSQRKPLPLSSNKLS